MVFIDGAYLRRRLSEWFGNDRIDLAAFVGGNLVRAADFNVIHGELVRAYFYDAPCPRARPEQIPRSVTSTISTGQTSARFDLANL